MLEVWKKKLKSLHNHHSSDDMFQLCLKKQLHKFDLLQSLGQLNLLVANCVMNVGGVYKFSCLTLKEKAPVGFAE